MARFGYLNHTDRLLQAEAFVRCRDHGDGDWTEFFDWWVGPECKDFHPGDAEGIRRIVREIMVAGGVSTLVDPLVWLEIGREEGAA